MCDIIGIDYFELGPLYLWFQGGCESAYWSESVVFLFEMCVECWVTEIGYLLLGIPLPQPHRKSRF